MSGQYSYPSVPNQPAYAAAPRQQQRSGPIIVGVTSATSAGGGGSSAAVASTTTSIKVHPAGQGPNGSLSVLGSYASSLDKSRKRGRSDCICALDRLVPPLVVCAKKSIKNHDDDGLGEDGDNGNKKMRGADIESGESNVGGDKSGSGNGNDDTSNRSEYIKQLQKELEEYKQQNQLLMKRRNNIFRSMVALHEVYETGLDGIARMNDLRFVPDNVMPDKIPK